MHKFVLVQLWVLSRYIYQYKYTILVLKSISCMGKGLQTCIGKNLLTCIAIGKISVWFTHKLPCISIGNIGKNCIFHYWLKSSEVHQYKYESSDFYQYQLESHLCLGNIVNPLCVSVSVKAVLIFSYSGYQVLMK